MSKRAEQKAQSRQAIVASAASLLRAGGVGGTTVQAAMKGAGLTVGAFYAHFDDKDDLVSEAFRLALVEVGVLIEGAAEGLVGAAAVRAVAARYLSEEHRDEVRLGCPLPATFGEASAEHSPATQALLAEGLETMCRRVAAVAPGLLDAEQLRELVGVMVGGQVLARALRGTPMSSDVLASSRRACDAILAQGRDHQLGGSKRPSVPGRRSRKEPS